MTYLITNIRIIDAEKDFTGSVFIENGKIKDVSKTPSIPLKKGDEKEIDGTGKILMPGLIDPHVHFREPGLTHKEDFYSGSRAAVSAGVTTFFDMPNTIPPTFTQELLEEKRAFARKSSIANFGLFFGAGPENLKEIKAVKNVPGTKLYLDATTGNLKMDDEEKWREIFRIGEKVVLHAEAESLFRALEIWREESFPCEIHVAHLSLKSEVEIVRTFRKKKKAKNLLTAEVGPRHLLLTKNDEKKLGNFAFMKPDLATDKDRKALWRGVEDGTIDFFATDHAPHTIEEKEKGAFGVPGVETFFPLLFTEFQRRKWDLKKFVAMTSLNATKIYHFKDKKGKIETGYDGDLVLIDPGKEWIIDPSKFYSKAKWSPFEGWKVKGKVEKTFVNGILVFDQGKLMKDQFRGGLEIKFKT